MSSNCFPWENSSCEFTATFYWPVEGEATSVCTDLGTEEGWRRIDPVMMDAADDSFEEILFSFFFIFMFVGLYIYRERDDNSRDKESKNILDIFYISLDLIKI